MPVRGTKRGTEHTRLQRDCDVLVCGASFAGLAVARELAGAGARVLMIDRYELGDRQTSACAMRRLWIDALDERPARTSGSRAWRETLRVALRCSCRGCHVQVRSVARSRGCALAAVRYQRNPIGLRPRAAAADRVSVGGRASATRRPPPADAVW